MFRKRLLPALWFALVLVSMAAWIGSYPLMQPDEGRNAEVGREMAASGDYIVPHLNGLPYVDKPFLHFAAVGASIRAFGATEAATRLPSLVFTLLSAAMLVWFGRRVWRAEVGWAAAGMMLTAPLAFAMSRVVILDAMFASLVLGSVLALYLAVEGRAGEMSADTATGRDIRWRRWSLLAWACMGLGILTKGPVALLIPLISMIPYSLTRRSLRAVLDLPAIALAILIVTPWVVLMSRELPGYLHYVVVTETWGRITSDELRRTKPFWYFVPVLAAGTFPWICMAIAGLWRRRRDPARTRDPRIVFLLLWIVLPFLFFSLSRAKMPHYVLPLVPAVVLLAAVLGAGRSEQDPPGRTSGSILLGLLGVAAIVVASRLPVSESIDPATLIEARPLLRVFGLAAFAAGALGLVARPRGLALVAAFALPVMVAGLASAPLLKAVGTYRSADTLAHVILKDAKFRSRVIGVEAYPTALPFYLGATIDVSTTDGNQLTSNYVRAEYDTLVNAPHSTLHDANYWLQQLAQCSAPTYFVVRAGMSWMARRLNDAGVPEIANDRKYAVYGPCQRED